MSATLTVILNFILALLERAVPFLLAYKAGKSSEEVKELKATVKGAEVRNAIEAETATMDRAAIIDSLRDNEGKLPDVQVHNDK